MIDLVVGTRPNFVKIAVLIKELKKFFPIRLIHTGQHFDYEMNKLFFKQLNIPEPDYYLDVKAKTNSEQTGLIILKYSNILKIEKPDLTMVVGDVNSTMAAAVAAKQNNILVAHVEAGLRNYKEFMPEEINRVVTDRISNFLFTYSVNCINNLKKEGINQNNIFFVGNVMIDTLKRFLPAIKKNNILKKLKLDKKKYALLTMHRPANVDRKEDLNRIIEIINQVSNMIKIIFPVHPRTKKNLEKFNLFNKISDNILMIEPLGYFEMIKLEMEAKLIITDSGGIQEESTFLKVPCITIRETTERPITVEKGTNEVVGNDKKKTIQFVKDILSKNWKEGEIPPLWDGNTSSRIVNIIKKKLPT